MTAGFDLCLSPFALLRLSRLAPITLACFLAPLAQAQSTSVLQQRIYDQGLDAGKYLRETRPQGLPALPRNNYSLPTAPAATSGTTAGHAGASLIVKRFQFSGNKNIDSEELMAAVPFLKNPDTQRLTLSQLDTLAAQVTDYYRSQGYFVASAFVLGQEVRDGTVTITILEGALDKSQVSGDTSYAPDDLKKYLDQALCSRDPVDCSGVVLERRRADRAAGIISDLPGVQNVSAVLSPGSRLGSSNLTLQATARPQFEGYVGADNYGGKNTGRSEYFGHVQVNNPLSYGDRLSADLKTSRHGGAKSAILDYSAPIGYDGWRAGLNYTRSHYELGEDFAVLGAHGSSNAITASLSYPIIRSLSTNMYFRAGYSRRNFNNYIDSADYHQRKRESSPSLGIDGSAIDAVLGGGVTAYSLTLTDATFEDLEQDSAKSHFVKSSYSLFRDQTLAYPSAATRVSLYGAVRGQHSDYVHMDSYEQFGLGGPDGVRAYPGGNAPGFRGIIGTLEARLSTSVDLWGISDLTFALFRDHGASVRSTSTATETTERRVRRGNGLSLTLNRREGYQIKAVWARRDKKDKLETPTDDEEDKRSRFWLQGILFF